MALALVADRGRRAAAEPLAGARQPAPGASVRAVGGLGRPTRRTGDAARRRPGRGRRDLGACASPPGSGGGRCSSRRTPAARRGRSRSRSSTAASGLTHEIANHNEYLLTARQVHDVPALLSGFVDRIPVGVPGSWPTHVAGHPPGALLLFVGLVGLGLGGSFASALVLTLVGCTTPVAVLVTLRRLGAEDVARRAAPFLVLAPAAIWVAVSADGVFAAVAAWGLAAVAAATSSVRRRPSGAGVCSAGCCSAACLLLSYGLPLLAPLVLAVLAAGAVVAPVPRGGPRGGRAGARVRRTRVPAVVGLPGPARPLRGGDRGGATGVVLALGGPRGAADLRGPGPRRRRRLAAGRRAALAARRTPPRRGGRPGRARRRRVSDEQGRGGADLAAVPAVAPAGDGVPAGAVAPADARGRRSWSRCWSSTWCSPTGDGQARSGSVRNAASPSSGPIAAVKPRSRCGPGRRGHDVADVAEAVARRSPPAAGPSPATAAATSRIAHRRPGADVVRRRGSPAAPPRTAVIASRLARATSSTCTKSRIWPPSSNTRGASPRSTAERNIAATPEYGVSRGIPGP